MPGQGCNSHPSQHMSIVTTGPGNAHPHPLRAPMQLWPHTNTGSCLNLQPHRARPCSNMQALGRTHGNRHGDTRSAGGKDVAGQADPHPPTLCACKLWKNTYNDHTEARVPHRMLAHTPTGPAPACLHQYMFLGTHVYGYTASFSCVPSVCAMAITHAHGCTTTCTHAEPCVQMHSRTHACMHVSAAQIPVLPHPAARSSHLLQDAGAQGMCRI